MAEDKKTITSLSVENRVFKPPADISKKAYVKSMKDYEKIYAESIKDPPAYWAKVAEEEVEWFQKWDKVFEWDPKEAKHQWFIGGKLNVSYNCLDRHVKGKRKDKVALIWQGNEDKDVRKFTYGELFTEVNKFATVLKSLGVKRGDRISIYLPMIPELAITMLACTRIGAIHSIVFGGFSADSLKDRMLDGESSVLITSDGSFRGAKAIPLKVNADKALESTPLVKKVVVVNRANLQVEMKAGRDYWWHELMAKAGDKTVEPEKMDAEDPLFLLYTSGSTGKPKGVLHTTGGYLVYVTKTFREIFDYHEQDIFWCTADIGWVTGHSYIVYGPLSAGATSIMFEGVPNYPDPGRFWQMIEKFKVTQFYTAPTAIRALMKDGESWVKKYNKKSLKVLGSVGEPINPEAWIWYYTNVGEERCPIVDTWWQTETGGILITPLPGAIPTKPGSATRPFFGIEAAVINEKGQEVGINEGGYLIIRKPWPGLMRTVYKNHKRWIETYWSQYPGIYFTGDGARKDKDGYFWIMGRVDDVINVSGHRLGTAEVESALVAHKSVAEAAVVGYPHEIKGTGIYAYVTLKTEFKASDDLKKELINHVRKEIGPIATPDKIQFAEALPKTRSGKIMRRILKKIAANEIKELGDTSTLADPSVVETLVLNRL